MKTLLTATSILISICLFGQQDLTFPVLGNASFNWKTVEKKPSKTVIDKFVKATPKEFQAYKQNDPDIAFLNLDSLHKDLHFLDLNGDGKDDVVFDGQSGGEAKEVSIFINTGQSYKKVFSTFQGIVKMEWQDKQLIRLYIDDWGCCDDYLIRHMIYNVNYTKENIPSFKKIYQSVSIDYGVTANNLLESAFRFEVVNDGYKIRFAPKIDDTSAQPWDNDSTGKGTGNCIARLVKGTTGTAIAKKMDNQGREWLFVQIDEKYLPKNDIIYIENKFPTKLMGWISSRFVKTL